MVGGVHAVPLFLLLTVKLGWRLQLVDLPWSLQAHLLFGHHLCAQGGVLH